MGPWDKSVLFKSYDEAGVYLGVLDTIFMVCYSIGLYLSGWIGERVEVTIYLFFVKTLFLTNFYSCENC